MHKYGKVFTGRCIAVCHNIIIIGKTAPFEPWPFLEYHVGLHPIFIFLDFATIILLQNKIVSLGPNPELGGPGP
jgi:hypothetical protein